MKGKAGERWGGEERRGEERREEVYLGSEGHASRDKHATVCYSCGHHAEFAFFSESDKVLHLFFEARILEVLLDIGIGWLIAGICVAERHLVGFRAQLLV